MSLIRTIKTYRRFITRRKRLRSPPAPLSQEVLGAIREVTNKAWVLGSERFQKRLAHKLARRLAPLRRGRPRIDHD